MSNADNPFGGMPFFGDLARLMGAQGPVAWEPATQLAMAIATEGSAEANVDPLERIRLTELARIVEVQVNGLTGLDVTTAGRSATVEPVTRSVWAHRTIQAFKPRFERFATTISADSDSPGSAPTPPSSPNPSNEDNSDPSRSEPPVPGLEDLAGLGDELSQFDQPHPSETPPDPLDINDEPDSWLTGMLTMLSPMLLGMTAGSLVGHLSRNSFGVYDLPIPRPDGSSLMVIPASIDEFATQWSIDTDSMRLAVLTHEFAHHAVLGIPHVRSRLDELLGEFSEGFRPDPDALERRLSEFDPTSLDGLASFQQLMGDPEILVGATSGSGQRTVRPQLDALVATIIGYVEHVGGRVAERLIADHGRIGEAIRRSRVADSEADRFVQQLFGLELSSAAYDRGSAFISGIVERSGDDALNRLWDSAETLPTPAEVDAPGLWLARIDLPS